MLKEEKILEIRILSRRGLSIRAIARELGISRNTVRKYLRGEAIQPVEHRGPGRPRKLEPYEDWIRRRVEAAAPIVLPATVLHREVTAMGFDGTVRTERRFMATLRPEPVIEPVVRFETAPGHQCQATSSIAH
jgi:transposase